ncbi:MAG: dATP/dGTP diphosphohydrolase domain-containing protein [Candidatus Njordarchaeales archaeon]
METNRKNTKNPKDIIGSKKLPMSVLPATVLGELALAMYEGSRKYGRHNYRAAGVRAEVYYDACFRHLLAWWEVEDIDQDSGINHIAKAMACLTVLRDSMLVGNWIDDRPPKSKNGWVKEMNKKTEEIIKKYPKYTKPYTEK